jgi:hypothetical protein
MKEIFEDTDDMTPESPGLLLTRLFLAAKNLEEIGITNIFSVENDGEMEIVITLKNVGFDKNVGFVLLGDN